MNERIRELAEQANNAIGGNAFSMARYNEKFAELIVRECADLVQDDDDAFDILKHFGVEE